MKYTAEELRTLCISALGGAAASTYNVGDIYHQVLKPALLALGYTEEYLMKNIAYRIDRYTLILQFRSKKMVSGRWDTGYYSIMSIEGKRKKGETHYYRYSGGSYADYTWKDFEVDLYTYATLAEAVRDTITKCTETAEKANDRTFRVYCAIRDAFPEYKDYELREILKTINNNTYTLEDKYDELHGKKV